MRNPKVKNGDIVEFISDYAFPSLTRKMAKVVDIWRGSEFIRIEFLHNGEKMAARKTEIGIY